MNTIKINFLNIVTLLLKILIVWYLFSFGMCMFMVPKLPSDKTTKVRMNVAAQFMQFSIQENGCSNIVEHLNKTIGIHSIPQILNYDSMYKILENNLPGTRATELMPEGVFWDAWDQPITITLITNLHSRYSGRYFVMMHSKGKNKKDENGKGDDIVSFFEDNMQINEGIYE